MLGPTQPFFAGPSPTAHIVCICTIVFVLFVYIHYIQIFF